MNKLAVLSSKFTAQNHAPATVNHELRTMNSPLLRFLMRLVLAAALAKLLQLKTARYGLLVLSR